MDLKIARYHPMRFELIRGDDDARAAFWDSVDAWEQDPRRNLEACETSDGVVDRVALKHLQHAEDAAWSFFNSFEQAGQQIFSLSPGLTQLLAESSIEELPSDMVKLPFPSVYLHFGAEAGIRSAVTGIPIDGAYVSGFEKDGALRQISVYGTPEAPFLKDCASWSFLDRIKADSQLGYYEQHLELGQGKTFGAILAEPFENPYQRHDEVSYWREELKLRSIMEDNGRAYTIKSHNEAVTGWSPSETDVLWRSQEKALVRLIINALCYLTHEGREIVLDYPDDMPGRLVRQARSDRAKESARAVSKLESMGYRKVYICGQSVKSQATRSELGVSPATHWRRGHWRSQAHGSGLRDRKLIWVKPTLVSPGRGETVVGHVYVASQDPDRL